MVVQLYYPIRVSVCLKHRARRWAAGVLGGPREAGEEGRPQPGACEGGLLVCSALSTLSAHVSFSKLALETVWGQPQREMTR